MTYEDLAHDVAPGDKLMLDDGQIVLEVTGGPRHASVEAAC